jgi:tetratricopeptide (TPR) repeat protein
MKNLLFTITLIFFSFLSFSQSIEFDKDNFPGKKDEMKAARKQVDIGTEFYMQGRKEFEDFKKSYFSEHRYYPVSHYDYQKSGYNNFRDAISPLGEGQRFNPNNARLNYMLGFISFITDPTTPQTLKYFETAYKLDPIAESDMAFWLAWSYQLNSRWDEAIKHYQLYLSQGKKNAGETDDVNKKIAECNSGKKYSATPERVFVDNLGSAINSTFPEYGPSISADEETIIFTA